jgi:hypothetical protein
MAQIKIKTEKGNDLTFIVLLGKVTSDTINNALKSFYGSAITTKVLWDFSNCDVTELEGGDLCHFVETAKRYGHQRIGGKTAIVTPSDIAFGIARMFKSRTEMDGYPVQAEIFRTKKEALAWLES